VLVGQKAYDCDFFLLLHLMDNSQIPVGFSEEAKVVDVMEAVQSEILLKYSKDFR
jgi:hypothetical protein